MECKRPRYESDDSSYSPDNQFLLSKKPILTLSKQSSAGEFYIINPAALCIDPIIGYIYVTENSSILSSNKPVINVFSPQGYYVTSFGRNVVNSPCQISMTIDRHSLYILNQFTQGITQFTDYMVTSISSIDSSLPRGIVCDEDGLVYIIDAYRRRICVFSPELKALKSFYLNIVAFPVNLDILSDILVILCNPTSILYFSVQGEKLRLVSNFHSRIPQSNHFCVDTMSNNSYISDGVNGYIKIFNMDGDWIRSISLCNDTLCGQISPKHIAITPCHTLVVVMSDSTGTNVKIFDYDNFY